MIFWTGYGILVPLIVGACALPFMLGLQAMSVAYSEQLGAVLGSLLAAPIVWFVGLRLERKDARVLVDPQTGQTVVLRRSDSLMFIPFKWWGVALPVFIVLGAALDIADQAHRLGR